MKGKKERERERGPTARANHLQVGFPCDGQWALIAGYSVSGLFSAPSQNSASRTHSLTLTSGHESNDTPMDDTHTHVAAACSSSRFLSHKNNESPSHYNNEQDSSLSFSFLLLSLL